MNCKKMHIEHLFCVQKYDIIYSEENKKILQEKHGSYCIFSIFHIVSFEYDSEYRRKVIDDSILEHITSPYGLCWKNEIIMLIMSI